MSFQISDKVVCIDAFIPDFDKRHFAHPNGYVQLGTVYCVERELPKNGIAVVGLPCCWRESGREVGWHSSRFRKIGRVRVIAKAIKGES